ncbi:MAG: DNA-directed RNA polymerase subunit beta [Chloroflexota bacterium]|nr:DNA-directed RNA polymerase subunit beta [Chloroflexota bacterium]
MVLAPIGNQSAEEGQPSVTEIVDYSRLPDKYPLPNLIKLLRDSYDWFLEEGLRELLEEMSPIEDFTGNRMQLYFMHDGEDDGSPGYEYLPPTETPLECRQKDKTYQGELRVKVGLTSKKTGESKQQWLYFGHLPHMTETGTFIINGAERVVVSQLVRSPGVYFGASVDSASGRTLCAAKLIPSRGAWLEFESSNRDVLTVKVDRKRKIAVTTLLRALDDSDDPEFYENGDVEHGKRKEHLLGTDERILAMLDDIDMDDSQHQFLATTLEKEAPGVPAEQRNKEWAMLEVYKRLRPGDPPTLDAARSMLEGQFFNPRRYDLGRVGRYKVNTRLHGMHAEIDDRCQRLGLDRERGDADEARQQALWMRDLLAIIFTQVAINNGIQSDDDIDHLGNRRIRAVGEQLQNQFRIGMVRMERVIRERMTIIDPDQAAPSALVNIRPVQAAVKEFFGGHQLSQFMDQTNPLAELTHKRRLSALGPGGLSRDRAGFDVRDVHYSHYGRICPIETPEGPNIGLIGSLATYGVLNEYGFIKTPYRIVVTELAPDHPDLIGRVLYEPVEGDGGVLIADDGDEITVELAERIHAANDAPVRILPFVSDDVVELTADDEANAVIAQANARLDARGYFLDDRVEGRLGRRFEEFAREDIEYMDVSPRQIVSVAASLIPFLEHDDANRALMGANMQRQAVPLVRPEAPLVGTGMEQPAARDSGQVLSAEADGEVRHVTAEAIVVHYDDPVDGEQLHSYSLLKFLRSNQGTCINQRAIVSAGDRISAGQPLADSSSTDQGRLALGQNVLAAFMSWEGYNFEDAVIVSERLVQNHKFTSIHMSKHEVGARETKLGNEEITRDIPNVADESLAHLDAEGIVRIGAEVRPGDILVGKITPKGETELTAEEKLLRAIFGEKAREVKDTSLRVSHGVRGVVVDVRVFNRDEEDELPAGMQKLVRVTIAERRKLQVGDKMAGRHGNKGVISTILPVEDMPHLEDGTPIDVVLSPIGVPSRMNLGQILETQLGWAANQLGFRAITPVFDGASEEELQDALARAWIVREAQSARTLNGANGAASQTGGANGADDRLAEADQRSTRELEASVLGAGADPRTRAWLEERGYDEEMIHIAFDRADRRTTGAASRIALAEWLIEHGETRAARNWSDATLVEHASRIEREQRVARPVFGKQRLVDGRSGELIDQPVTVGFIYLLKLSHMVEDKIHARSTGPYSLITQQPLGGKAQFGGQRFGEMEVWALEAYGAANILQELLTVKSDDIVGRVKAYEAIVKGEPVTDAAMPESFRVLLRELQSLGLHVEVRNQEDEAMVLEVPSRDEMPQLGVNLSGFEGEDVTSA